MGNGQAYPQRSSGDYSYSGNRAFTASTRRQHSPVGPLHKYAASRISVMTASKRLCPAKASRKYESQRCHHETEEAGQECLLAKQWNRASRKRIQSSTLSCKFAASKDKWPVSCLESLFLPDFPVRGGPQEIDNFEVLAVIASGSFGNVLKVRREDDKKIYALKVVDKARLVGNGHAVVHQAKEEARIQRSLASSGSLSSGFVASLMGHWQTRKRLYLLVEYFPQGELSALWEQYHRQLPEALAGLYVAELACGLEHLHRAGVIYRDLKLENVVLDSRGHPVFIDFGLSKRLRRGDMTRTMCGTLAYSAPEMLNGRPYNHSADWWSLGVLFYALVAGKLPVDGICTCQEMHRLMCRHPYEAPQHLSWQCRYTLEQLLQKSPARRISSQAGLARMPFYRGAGAACPLDFALVRARAYDPRHFSSASSERSVVAMEDAAGDSGEEL